MRTTTPRTDSSFSPDRVRRIQNVLVRVLLAEVPFRLELEVDNAGQLHRVILPPAPPEAPDPGALGRLLARLNQFPPAPQTGSPFSKAVWTRISQIPPGKTLTYSQLAIEIRHPNAHRAVGSACGRNPLLLRIPCHRVKAVSGPGGYAAGQAWKRALLEMETHQTGIAQSVPPTLNHGGLPRDRFSGPEISAETSSNRFTP
ncbi:MAG: Methylated-DNA--protein-cysteine methyltransferase, constitutive [Verrucomicrobiota bacterium]